MSVKRKGDKSLLSKQEIASRRKALTQKKNATSGSGRRAILGVAVLAFSVMSLLAVATFDAADRVGPGFKNAVGPVGHAIAEALRGLLGVCAYVLPMVGLYAAGIMFVGDREKRRWPQAIALGLLLIASSILAQLMFKEDATWAHAPGGLIGREIGGVLTALFSTVGTVVLVSAIAAVAFIVGTQFAFLRFVNFVWEKSQAFGTWAKAQAIAWYEKQKTLAAQRREQAAKDEEEEAAFLEQLEAEEAELAELEATAHEAEAAADEAMRIQQGKENAKLADLAEKERLKAEREKALVEREAARLAREALKTARANRKDQQKEMAAAIAPGLLHDLRPPTAMAVHQQPVQHAPLASNGDPAWAAAFAFQQPPPPPAISSPPLPSEYLESVPPPPKRVPNIIEAIRPTQTAITEPPQPAAQLAAAVQTQTAPAVAPPSLGSILHPTASPQGALLEAHISSPKLAPLEASLAGVPPMLMDSATAAAPVAAAVAVGATALARMPLIVEPKAPPKPTKKEKKQDEFVFSGGRSNFDVPPIDVLEVHRKERAAIDKDVYLQTAEKLTAKLKDFGIDGEVVEIRPGPVVTMYEFKPAPGVKISRIASLSDDLAMAMEAMRVRIVAPIPGKGVVGVEVPNKDREMVFLKEIAEQDAFQKSQSRLTMCLGKDIEGMPYILDLAKAPHLLMAGTTGSGKSVSVNAMIMSILLKSTPEEVRFIMVDPKMLELSVYEGIPHLLLPVVTDPRKASIALQWAVDEMTRRYKLLAEAGVRNITGYNTLVEQEQAKKRASQMTVEAKAAPKTTVIKPKEEVAPVIPSKVEEAAKPVEAIAAPAPTPPKKKRRMLIVDVADPSAEATATPPEMPAVAAEAPAGLELGVAAPKDEATDPREAVEAAPVVETVTPAAVEAEAAAKEGEIRVDEPTAEEAAALAQAAAPSTEEPAADGAEEKKKLPYIVVIIDELADLMMVASKEVETSIARLAQMARAAGIHLMVATQRPSTDVVTGIIKANFPTRISFMLRSKPDSMTILGTIGAEALLGMGDMLIMPPTSAHLQRVHGCFVSEHEIKKVVDHLKAQGTPVYDESILKPREEEGAGEAGAEDELHDELYDQAIAIVSEMRTVSISILQRKMRIGYNRSARMIERMEREGLVGPADGAKPRDVLVKPVGQMPGAGAMM